MSTLAFEAAKYCGCEGSALAASPYNKKALRSSGIVNVRNAVTSKGSPISGKPASCDSHKSGGPAVIAKARIAATPIRRRLLPIHRMGDPIRTKVGKLRRHVANCAIFGVSDRVQSAADLLDKPIYPRLASSASTVNDICRRRSSLAGNLQF